MTIDERLDRLTARHEALTEVHRTHASRLGGALEAVQIALQPDGENIRALARIAEIHERRLTHLEGPPE